MIFAPRSWPSRPGFAITTRIFRSTGGAVYGGDASRLECRRQARAGGAQMKLTVIGCSPAWPNPGGAQSGYLVEGPGRLLLDCGPGVLARLRAENSSWPAVDAVVVTHWHLDHWGDLVPWVWGVTLGPGMDTERPELWVPPEGREVLSSIGGRLG